MTKAQMAKRIAALEARLAWSRMQALNYAEEAVRWAGLARQREEGA